MLIPGNSRYDECGEEKQRQEQPDPQAIRLSKDMERFVQTFKLAYDNWTVDFGKGHGKENSH